MPTRTWTLAHGRSLEIGDRALVMGILNVTPDSFSDGGRFHAAERAIEHAARMIGEGADIIDIGGESTRPGAEPVTAEEEQRRILPVIEKVAAMPAAIVSVDTYRAETARLALEAGAHIVNDVWGLSRERAIADLAAASGAGLAIMHTGRERQKSPDVIEDQRVFLTEALQAAERAGVKAEQIVLDPGFGFAKDAEENLSLIARFEELHHLGFPQLVGTSRKRFIGTVTGRDGDERDIGTAATSVALRMKGAAIFRVHNVAMNRAALDMADAVLQRQNGVRR
ncbi:MAG: dihydropteroate synthase [Rhizobiaceae bacterium]|nr:dihydropteroate synthase [Rhizobiaceae bacterium]